MAKETTVVRNLFHVLLMKKFIKTEATMVFGRGEPNLIKYLSMERKDDQNTVEKIRKAYRYNKTREGSARSSVQKVINRRKLLKISDYMLDRIVKRLTFFGEYSSWENFTHAFKEAQGFTHLVGVPYNRIPPEDMLKLYNTVTDLHEKRTNEILSHGVLHGFTKQRTFISFSTGHLMRPAYSDELFLIQSFHENSKKYDLLRSFLDYDQLLKKENNSLFVLMDHHGNIAGSFVLVLGYLPVANISLEKLLNKDFSLKNLIYKRKPNCIFMADFYAINDMCARTILLTLAPLLERNPQMTTDNPFVIFKGLEKKFSTVLPFVDNGFLKICLESNNYTGSLKMKGFNGKLSSNRIVAFFVSRYNQFGKALKFIQ